MHPVCVERRFKQASVARGQPWRACAARASRSVDARRPGCRRWRGAGSNGRCAGETRWASLSVHAGAARVAAGPLRRRSVRARVELREHAQRGWKRWRRARPSRVPAQRDAGVARRRGRLLRSGTSVEHRRPLCTLIAPTGTAHGKARAAVERARAYSWRNGDTISPARAHARHRIRHAAGQDRRQPLAVHQHFENPDQRALLVGRQPRERMRARAHPAQHPGPHARPRGRQHQHLHAPVLTRGLAANQPPRFEPIDQPGDVRRVARERARQPPHRHRPARLEQMQHVALRRREVELGRRPRHVGPLGKEELDEQLPGATSVRFGSVHNDLIILPDGIVDF